MAERVIEIEGLDELYRALEEMPDKAVPLVEKAMIRGLLSVQGRVEPYPPQPDRNRAGTFNTYVRGIGHFPKSSFVGGRRKKRGAYTPGPHGGKVRRVSERLGSRWAIKVVTDVGNVSVTGTLGNNASYANVVQGDRQAAHHALTGWVTLDDAVDQSVEDVEAAFDEAIDQVVDWFNEGG